MKPSNASCAPWVPGWMILRGSISRGFTMSVPSLGFMASSRSRFTMVSVSMLFSATPANSCLILPAMAVFFGMDFRGGMPPLFLRSQLDAAFSFSFFDFMRYAGMPALIASALALFLAA